MLIAPSHAPRHDTPNPLYSTTNTLVAVIDISSGSLSFEDVRIKYLGRKGLIVDLFSQMSSVSSQDRPALGSQLNSLKSDISEQLENHVAGLDDSGSAALSIDYTLPGNPALSGSIHPLTQVLDEIKSIFKQIGFSLAYGPGNYVLR